MLSLEVWVPCHSLNEQDPSRLHVLRQMNTFILCLPLHLFGNEWGNCFIITSNSVKRIAQYRIFSIFIAFTSLYRLH